MAPSAQWGAQTHLPCSIWSVCKAVVSLLLVHERVVRLFRQALAENRNVLAKGDLKSAPARAAVRVSLAAVASWEVLPSSLASTPCNPGCAIDKRIRRNAPLSLPPFAPPRS
eukprot:366362-Chlamydomonas_euryale.AAC.7